MIHEAHKIRDKGGGAEILRVNSEPPASMVKGDALIVLLENRNLLPPTEVIAASPVCKDNWEALPVDLVVDFSPIYWCEGHGETNASRSVPDRATINNCG